VPAARSVPPRITLLTDFGTRDGYVAAMKGVIAARAPAAIIDDASHDIDPGDVHGAAWAIAGYWRRYPAGTVHVAVVDPGVGTARRALAIDADRRIFVGPDNGVFTRALGAARTVRAFAIENPTIMSDAVSATFHGRDIFAPAAAYLAGGGEIHRVGGAVGDLVRIDVPEPRVMRNAVRGVVVHVDRFGNLVTNIRPSLVRSGAAVRIADCSIPMCRTYADVASGELCAVVGSADVLEVSVRDGSAAERLAVVRGEAVTVS